MVMIWYAGTPSDYGAVEVTSGADTLVGFGPVTLDVHTERSTGSTQLDDTTMQDAAGTGINQLTWTVDDLPDNIWFQADTDATGGRTVFGTPDSGTTWYMFHPDNKHNVDRIAAVEAGTTPPSLGDLTDVTKTGSEADGSVLTLDTGTGVATFQPASTGTSIGDLSDGNRVDVLETAVAALEDGAPSWTAYGPRHVVLDGSGDWNYQGQVITERPDVPAWPDSWIKWDTHIDPNYNSPPPLAADHDEWKRHKDVSVPVSG